MKAVILVLSIVLAMPVWGFRFGESGPGNGTDYVKILFAEAQFEVLRRLEGIEVADLESLSLSPLVKSWLSGFAPGRSTARIELLQSQMRRIDLRFQKETCGDHSQRTASICFYRDDGDYVLISLDANRLTTLEQAMAMLIHETGHFLGETDHRLLDQVGVELVAGLRSPTLLLADAEATEIVANVFQAKADCDLGQGSSARNLAKRAITDLLARCSERGVQCDPQKIQLEYQGEAHFKDGAGFDMRVTCRVRAVFHR